MAKLHLAQQILDIIYPVGSIYLSDNATNPNTKFGGTWVKLSGGFIYGSTITSGNTYSTGNGTGTATNSHTLTIDQIPSHSHSGSTGGGKTAFIRAVAVAGGSYAYNHVTGHSSGSYKDFTGGSSDYPGANHFHDFTTGNTGGGKGHSHNIPYIACSIWRRTA